MNFYKLGPGIEIKKKGYEVNIYDRISGLLLAHFLDDTNDKLDTVIFDPCIKLYYLSLGNICALDLEGRGLSDHEYMLTFYMMSSCYMSRNFKISKIIYDNLR